MQNYAIGVSGLSAARAALDVIGNNITNAATEGYHRQRVELTPAYSSKVGSVWLGGGVDVKGVTRMVDSLLEHEILRQQSILEQLTQEFTTLRSVEGAFGELSSTNGLNGAIDEFFNALNELNTHPGEDTWQSNVISAADSMASQFRVLGDFLSSLKEQIRLQAEKYVETINTLTTNIAELNGKIQSAETTGTQANSLRDQRDQFISELSELVPVETQDRDNGIVDVSITGLPAVSNTSSMTFEIDLDADNDLGISIVGSSNYVTDVAGGALGGLFSLRNQIVSDIHTDLDSLANAIIQQINQYHVEGVGSAGSFTSLEGWTNSSGDLADFSTVSDGYIYIRVTNTSTSAVTRTAIPVDQSDDTLAIIAGRIDAVPGVSASVDSQNVLTITADANYEFDFLPAVLPSPTASTLSGSPPTVSVSGIYTGAVNDTFQFTVVGTSPSPDDLVGNGDWTLEVRDGGGTGSVIATVNIGADYAAGDLIDIGNGIKIALTAGELNNGETFDVAAFADSDTSGLLAAVGINTFFSGNSSTNIAVCSDIAADSGRLATALGPGMNDNTNAQRMTDLKDLSLSSLDSLTIGEFHRRLVTDIGQQVAVKQMRRDNIRGMVQNLNAQKTEISGVDINDEAAQLLVFEQMFGAVAKYLSIVQSSLSNLMEIV